MTATTATVTGLSSETLESIGGLPYKVVVSRTASTTATVTSLGGGLYAVGDFTLTLRIQVYATTMPTCIRGALRCTMNLRLGLHGTYSGAISPPSGTIDLTGGTGYTGGIAISAPGCPVPLSQYHGRAATLTVPLVAFLP